jgi:hypothetical protein
MIEREAFMGRFRFRRQKDGAHPASDLAAFLVLASEGRALRQAIDTAMRAVREAEVTPTTDDPLTGCGLIDESGLSSPVCQRGRA